MHATAAHALTRDLCEYPHKLHTCQKLESLNYKIAAEKNGADSTSLGLSVITFTQLFSKAKERNSRRTLTRDLTVV